jgi:hypothetical protein
MVNISLPIVGSSWHTPDMPRRASRRDDAEDALKAARRVVEEATGEELVPKKKNPHAVALSRLGASKGGQARAAHLSAKKRKEIARKAAVARWKKSGRRKVWPTRKGQTAASYGLKQALPETLLWPSGQPLALDQEAQP